MRMHNPFDAEEELKQKLDQYTVEVPDFPVKKARTTRIANWVFAPTYIPFPEVGYKQVSAKVIVSLPLFIIPVTFIPILFFIK